MSERCKHDYPIDGDGSPGDRCHECIYDEGFAAGLEAAAKLAETYLKTSEQMADRSHVDHVTRGDLAANSHVQAEDIAADIRALKTSESQGVAKPTSRENTEGSSRAAEAPKRGASTITSDEYFRNPTTAFMLADRTQQPVHVQEYGVTRIIINPALAEPAGGERGAGVCKDCEGDGGGHGPPPWAKRGPRCGGTGKEPEVK